MPIMQALPLQSATQWVLTTAEGPKMSEKLVTALYEALYHPILLRDEVIMIKLGHALVHLSIRYEMDVAAGHERCPGLYGLLTHPDVAVRSLVS